MLTGVKELAKTSSVPGKTKLINFFEINRAWQLVDLPGYGYAKLSKNKQEGFNYAVSSFLTERDTLKHVFALVDSRLEPLEGDLAFVHWLQQCEVPFSVIFTKTDKVSDAKTENHANKFLETLESYDIKTEKAFSCSSKTSRGRNQILQFIESKLPQKKKTKGPHISLGWMNKHKNKR